MAQDILEMSSQDHCYHSSQLSSIFIKIFIEDISENKKVEFYCNDMQSTLDFRLAKNLSKISLITPFQVNVTFAVPTSGLLQCRHNQKHTRCKWITNKKIILHHVLHPASIICRPLHEFCLYVNMQTYRLHMQSHEI